MEFYVVEFPGMKSRVFLNKGDAKNCLGNLGPVHKGMIKRYSGKEVGIITGGTKNGKNIYVEVAN